MVQHLTHVLTLALGATVATANAPIKLLFLGDNGHHRPAERFAQLQPVMAKRGIAFTYTDEVQSLNPETLSKYDGLIVYANITEISPEQETALLEFVAGGKGFVPIHCASYCFLNSTKYVELVGAQFKRHGTGVFRTKIAMPDEPVMRGFEGFESWDETYVHDKHNEENRTVLSYRVDENGREPWTWIRTHGKGRVFYTAWGHDERTWSNPGFHNLIERGVRWAVGGDPSLAGSFRDPDYFPVPQMTEKRKDVAPFKYIKAKVPFYPPGKRWGTIEDGLYDMQSPLPAEESLKHIVTPQGFKVELFASEPDIVKPVCMTWDERGRCWVGETFDYPNELQPPGKGRDRIKICEDTNGDDRADKFTVFAEGLSIPTSITFANGGAIVQDGTETVYLKDTDGDDKADERRVLFSGWNMRDTHGGVSNFQYGLDNWIWAMQGYNNSRPAVQGKPIESAFRMGFFRFKPDGSELEFVRSTNNNTWGLGMSEEGLIFGSTANRNPSVYMPIPNRYYERVRGWSPSQLGTIADTHMFKPITDKVRQVDQHGGYTAAAGHALYTARTYPKEYWNRAAFVCGPTGKLVGTFVLRRDGADFRSTSPFNLMASDDEWTAPIMAEVGPDGNVWVLDWYNYIVQHNPTPTGYKTGKGNAYETELRDKRHGRIYRIVYEGKSSSAVRSSRAAAEPMSLADATPQQLVETLKHPNMLWRKHAQRLLVERGELDVLPQLVEMTADTSVDQVGLNAGVVHALWTMHGLQAFNSSNPSAVGAVKSALLHPSAAVRRNAALAMPKREDSVIALLQAGLLVHEDAQVGLATLLALSDMPKSQAAGEAVATLLTIPRELEDRWIADAATSAAAVHALPFLKEIAANRAPLRPRAQDIVRIVAEHYARGGPVDTIDALVALLPQADRRAVSAILDGLSRGWQRGVVPELSDDAEAGLVDLMPRLPVQSQAVLLKLASAWKTERLAEAVTAVVEALAESVLDEEEPDERRINAARTLIELRPNDAKAVNSVLEAISPRTPPALASGLFDAVAQAPSPDAAKLLLQRLNRFTPSTRAAAIQVLLQRTSWTKSLLDAIENDELAVNSLELDQRGALTSHSDPEIARRARKLMSERGGLVDPDRKRVLERLMPLTKKSGDVALGKAVFAKQCSKCHMHSGEGKKIGPDLTGMAVHPKAELLKHLIAPSSSVEGNYRLYNVVTLEGRILSGLLASESKTAIELFDVEGKKHVVLREDIDELVASPKSLMPDGFEKQISQEDIVNLLEFLTQRGRFLPIPLDKHATIVSTKGMFYDEKSTVERLIFPDWKPKTFEGVPFVLVDPQGDRVENVIMLNGPRGKFPPKMPKTVTLPCNSTAKAIHLLSGVSGWGAKSPGRRGVSMIVRLHYADGETEDHPLYDGEHFADYIGVFNVPKSKLAFKLRNQQIRYLAIHPKRTAVISNIELVKGPDHTAPVVMAVTVEAAGE